MFAPAVATPTFPATASRATPRKNSRSPRSSGYAHQLARHARDSISSAGRAKFSAHLGKPIQYVLPARSILHQKLSERIRHSRRNDLILNEFARDLSSGYHVYQTDVRHLDQSFGERE